MFPLLFLKQGVCEKNEKKDAVKIHSLSMKLPLSLWLRVLFCLPPPNMPRLPLPLLLLDRSEAPPAQNKTVEMKKQATAAHMNPKL